MLAALLASASSGPAGGQAQETRPAADRWEPTIAKFEEQDQRSPPTAGGILFVGSSSIRLWDVAESFPDLPVTNRGFGGSVLADAVRYAGRIIHPRRPRLVVVYAGDNDLQRGNPPTQVLEDFRQLAVDIHQALPDTRVLFLSVKPSLARWQNIAAIREANRLVLDYTRSETWLGFVDVGTPMLTADGRPRPELFAKDGLHLNDAGYQLWTELVRPHLP